MVLRPLIRSPGRLLLTNRALYLQVEAALTALNSPRPLQDFYSTAARPVEKHLLMQLQHVSTHRLPPLNRPKHANCCYCYCRFLLTSRAVRLEFGDGVKMLLAMDTVEECAELHNRLQTVLNTSGRGSVPQQLQGGGLQIGLCYLWIYAGLGCLSAL